MKLDHIHEECGVFGITAPQKEALTPENLKISHRATICMPYHKQMDILEEERLSDHAYGSTRSGIAPVYGDKYMKKSLRMEDLFSDDALLKEKVDALVEWKNLTVKAYGETLDATAIFEWLKTYGDHVKEYVTDVTVYLQQAVKDEKDIMFEAQLGALRDIDFGIYPYTTSSQTLAAYAPIGAGIPGERVDQTIGIMKAYSSCVGEGPFTAEWFGNEAEELREAGGEYGARTERPRRVGPVDIPASRYGAMLQGADCIALTKLDVLAYMKEIPICVAYEVDGEETKEFPTGDRLLRAKPVFQMMPGFGDVSACRKKEELPQEALDYIAFLEKEVGCPIRFVSLWEQVAKHILT